MATIQISSATTMLDLLESIDIHVTRLKMLIDNSVTHREKAVLGRKQERLEKTANSIYEMLQRTQNEG